MSFIRLNKNRDHHYNFVEYFETKGMEDTNLIKLNEKEPPFIGRFWLIIFTFLSLSNLYKLYIWLISIKHTITIIKVISIRNDRINDPFYNRYNPEVHFFDEIITYEHCNNFHDHNIVQRELPMYDNNNNNNENFVGYESEQRELPVNNNINNENLNQINVDDINIEIQKNNSISTKHGSNISKQE